MILQSAINLLQTIRQETNAIGVAFSCGKDSFAVMDLCCQVFDRIEAFYLYRVPDLQVIRRLCGVVENRYGVNVRHYPHFDLTRCFRYAVLQPHWSLLDHTPSLSMKDVESAFRQDAAVNWIAYGWRRNDSRSRALILKSNHGRDAKAKRIFPLRTWRRRDVLCYLSQRRIPIPPGFGRTEQGGVDFHPETLRYLKRYWPDDYVKIMEMFPYAESQIIAADRRRDRQAVGNHASSIKSSQNDKGE